MVEKYREDYGEGYNYEDFKVGDIFKTGGKTITDGDLTNYLSLSPNIGNGHVNNHIMEGKRVTNGLLTLIVSQGLFNYGENRRGPPHHQVGDEVNSINKIRWLQKVSFGETIYCESEVKDKIDLDDVGEIVFERRVYNQDDELVMVYEPTVLTPYKG